LTWGKISLSGKKRAEQFGDQPSADTTKAAVDSKG
jgi:hypothetical protein